MPARWAWPGALAALLGWAAPAVAGEADDVAAVTRMVHEFLQGASRNDLAAHARFWADDLVYTSSSGRRFGRDEILRSLKNAEISPPEEPLPVYTAENLGVRVHGDAAVVTFRLVGVATADAHGTGPEVTHYFNTGTLFRRDGEWRVVAWQATRIPDED